MRSRVVSWSTTSAISSGHGSLFFGSFLQVFGKYMRIFDRLRRNNSKETQHSEHEAPKLFGEHDEYMCGRKGTTLGPWSFNPTRIPSRIYIRL